MSFSRIRRFLNRQSTFADIPKGANGNNGLTKTVPFSTAETYFYGSLGESEVFPVTEPYIYNTLERNEIRIFWMLMSDRIEDEITGILETVTLDRTFLATNDKQYTSLSYAWGPTSEDGSHLTDNIICDGCRLKVTSNLKHALQRIRAHASAELMQRQIARPERQFDGMDALWIDAICINQDDIQERSAQVQNMGQIFAESKSLIIWLGEPDGGKLGKAQREMFRHLCMTLPMVALQPPPPALLLDSIHTLDNTRFRGQSLQDVLLSVLTRPWFSRRWVIQESAPPGVTGYVMLGSANCHRDLFTSLLMREKLINMAKPLQATTTKQSIFQTLYTYDDSQCEDARDRIFAVKDLSWHGKLIRVDYNQDLRATYLNLARAVVFRTTEEDDFVAQFRRHGSQNRLSFLGLDAFRMLALASCKKKNTMQHAGNEMESWYPDWTVCTLFDSDEHQQAVEIVVRDPAKPPLHLMVHAKHELLVAYNGYHYYATEGILVKADAQLGEVRPPFDEAEAQYRLRIQPWAESVYVYCKSYCEAPGAELDRIWLTMLAWSERERFVSPKVLAFVLRPSCSQPSFQTLPVYRLQSCFMIVAPPVIPCGPSWSDWVMSAQNTSQDLVLEASWRKLLTDSTPFLSWQEFCLE